MGFELRQTTPDDYQAIVDLCCAAMGATPDAPFLERAHMAWKCWDDHPWWEGARGYAIEKDGAMAAFGCAWPVFLRRGGETLPGFNLIDWAALDRFPGAGLILVKRLLREVPRMYTIGGTEDTTAVLPRMGFETINQHHLAAKPLRPLRQALTHQRRNWKLPVRLLRNLAWSRRGAGDAAAGWDAVPIADPGTAPQAWWVDPKDGTQCLRTADWYRYILSSPGPSFELYDLRRDGESQGFFCLSRCPGQTRIADYRIVGRPSDESWLALAALATEQARRSPDAAEITAWTSHEAFLSALEAVGFRKQRTDPVRCNKEEYRASAGEPCFFTGLDSDFAYLHSAGFDYAT